MKLDRAKKLITTEPNISSPHELLADVLAASIELLSIEDNDFSWSSWIDQAEAIAELQELLAITEAGALPDRGRTSMLYAPTGPLQEVSMSSGWAEPFLKVAERFDLAEQLLWGANK